MVNKDFLKNAATLKKEYSAIKSRVNATTHRGEELKEFLFNEIDKFDQPRFEIMSRLGEISSKFDFTEKKLHKQEIIKLGFVEMFKEAPYYNRIINKPQGYAGDAEMMNIIYRNAFEGETPFGMFLHKQAVLCGACQAVRNRREIMKEEILKRPGGNILNLGAGSAMEIKDVLDVDLEHKYSFHALDHDITSLKLTLSLIDDSRLKYSIANALRIMNGHYLIITPRKKVLHFCHPQNDFNGMKKISSIFKYKISKLKTRYDFAYSVGLPDYIRDDSNPEKGISGLTKNLFKLIKSGGSLIMGNFSDKNPLDIKFVMEYICDWNLIYRNKQQLLDFTKAIPEEKIKGSPKIFEDKTGINMFLKIDKKI